MADTKLSALSAVSVPVIGAEFYYVDPADLTTQKSVTFDRLIGFLAPGLSAGRLTLTSGTPVTSSDVTGATTVYYTPYPGAPLGGFLESLYDGTRWRAYALSEVSLALGTLTSGLPYDLFLYDSAGTLTLEALAWTNSTTRATALVQQNGVWCKTGALTRKYKGTFYTTATTTTEDSQAKRLLWNMHNRVNRSLVRLETTNSWTYTGSTAFRQANASTANQLAVMTGLLEDVIHVDLNALCGTPAVANAYNAVSIGVDSTTTPATGATVGMAFTVQAAGEILAANARFAGLPSAAGYHIYVWLEGIDAAGHTGTFYSDDGGSPPKRRYGLTGWCRA